MGCRFCDNPTRETDNYCDQCGYTLRWPTGDEWVRAPESLVKIAEVWHGGQISALYSVLSTGRIFGSEVDSLECELRTILRLGAGEPGGDEIERHHKAIEHLESTHWNHLP